MYDDLDDDALKTKVGELRDKLERVVGGGAVEVIAGEGRRKEFSQGNAKELRRLYTAARNELDRRTSGGIAQGRAIGVRYY
jgi:hypothetical protein